MPFLGTTGGGSVKQYGGQANLGYFIKNSLRTRSSASAYLNRTPATATNQKVWTWSAWVKRGTLGTDQSLFATTSANFSIFFGSGNDLRVWTNLGNGSIYTSAVYRDTAAWYHIVLQRTSVAPYFNLYVNGVQVTSFAYDNRTTYPGTADSEVNSTVAHYIGGLTGYYFDGYMAEINFIDGQALTPSSFGKTDAVTGQWIPKKFGGASYGTNGFYLKFADASAATAAAIGKDSSTNGNNWTPNNISVTAGATYDAMIDSPSLSAVASNYCTWNPIDSNSSCTFANGNLQVTTPGSGNDGHVRSTFGVSSGKWYWEIIPTTSGSLAIGIDIGFVDVSDVASYIGNKSNSYGYHSDSAKFNNATRTTYGATYAANNVMGVALDMDAGTLTFYKDNVSQGTAFTGLLSGFATPAVSDGGGATGQTYNANFGQQPFVYTPPTGFKSLNTFNLP